MAIEAWWHSSSHPNCSARLFPALGWTPCRSLWKQPRTAGSCCWTAQRVLTTCDDACVFHRRLVTNLLKVVAAKNLMLTQKLSLLSKRTTREKLMAYLAAEAQRAGSPSFTLSLDRQALADYLGVDRSAMSAELSKLRRDGLLQCKGRHVVLQKAHTKTH